MSKDYQDMNQPYDQIMQHILNVSSPLGMKLGLDNMRTACKFLGSPEKKIQTIHIAGTNGKGSVSYKIAKAFELGGYRCGIFTSPHISCFRERIRINQELISQESVVDIFEYILEKTKDTNIELTYFELCTLLALIYFSWNKVDIAVIEVGLGGRLDATNVISPILSVITSISYDHTDILGSTLEEITREKAGIIKPSIPVVIGSNVSYTIVKDISDKLNATLIVSSGFFDHYAQENSLIAKSCLEQLSFQYPFSSEVIKEALFKNPSCRFEKVPTENLLRSPFHCYSACDVILDVAHNPNGITKLIEQLHYFYPQRNYHFIINFASNKDIKGCAVLLAQEAAYIYICQVEHPRLAKKETLLNFFTQYSTSIFSGSSQETLTQSLLRVAEEKGVLIICGSFFIMSQMRVLLGYQEPCDQDSLNERRL